MRFNFAPENVANLVFQIASIFIVLLFVFHG